MLAVWEVRVREQTPGPGDTAQAGVPFHRQWARAAAPANRTWPSAWPVLAIMPATKTAPSSFPRISCRPHMLTTED